MPQHNQPELARYNPSISGGGSQTIVLAHGIGTDHRAWDRQVPFLEAVEIKGGLPNYGLLWLDPIESGGEAEDAHEA